MPNGMYGGVRGKETKVGQKTCVSRPTRLFISECSFVRRTLAESEFLYYFFRGISIIRGVLMS